MKKYKYIKQIVLGTFFLFVFLFKPNHSFAQSAEPDIKTSQTPFGQSIVVTFPQNYSGEVTSSFDGTSWKTQTKKYTQTDIDAMNQKIKKQQEAFQKMFEAQQAFFQQFWSSWPSFWF
jgi:hypothetical protein